MTAYTIVLGLDADREALQDFNAGRNAINQVRLDPTEWGVDDLAVFLHDDVDERVELVSIEVTP